MPFSATSYLAGVGTVFVAVTLGFAGGFALTNSKPEPPNRLERIAASAPAPSSPAAEAAAPVPKPDPVAPASPSPAPAPAAPQVVAAQAAVSEPAAPQPAVQPPPPAQEQSARQPVATPASALTKDDDAAELAKIREADLKAAERKRAQHRRTERQRRQQELEAAAAQVRQIDRDDRELVVQRAPAEPPRFGFFGSDD